MPTSRRQFLLGAAATGVSSGALSACGGAGEQITRAGAGDPSSAPSSVRPSAPSSAPSSAQPSARPSAQPSGDRSDLVTGPRASRAVALTFHGAGDPRMARAVLADAKAAGARLTILAVGTWLEANPTLARSILDGGHELGNHTWSHLPMRRLTATEATSQVQRAADMLVRLTGSKGTWFRPSGTPTSTPTIRAAAAAAGYPRCLAYDVDPRDYQDPGSAAILSRLRGTVRGGSIVSLHLGHPGTVNAMPLIFDLLQRKALQAVTVTRLVAS